MGENGFVRRCSEGKRERNAKKSGEKEEQKRVGKVKGEEEEEMEGRKGKRGKEKGVRLGEFHSSFVVLNLVEV